MHSKFLPLLLAAVALLCPNGLRADTAAFDLSGPQVEVKVTRNGKTLPIGRVPNLQAGDRLWIHPDLPNPQASRYLLITAFLKGPTNPPPENWFTRAETWNKKVQQEGIYITVPKDAQQALIFLAPETGGDFGSLRAAVRGKPGSFVRASQDLNQASLDRSRLDAYLTGVRNTSDTDPQQLHERSVLLARSLNIKVNQECFDKPVIEQESCLTKNTDQLVLDDGHSQSMVAALTSGPGSDLLGQLSVTRIAGGGMYSPYVGAVVDVARMMESFHTAQYQYIPALALPKDAELNLKLNNPPSFRKPMSVLVVGLPAVEAAQLPPMHPVNAKEVLCLQKAPLLLPVDGAPLVFSTHLSYDWVLHINTGSGHSVDLPAVADAGHGGFVVDQHELREAKLDSDVVGTLRGHWGFESFDGPEFHLRSARPAKWEIAAADRSALIVGRQDELHLQSDAAACVDDVSLRDDQGKPLKPTWKLIKANELDLQVPLKDAVAGPMTMLLKQSGLTTADEVKVNSYAEAAHLDRFTLHAGDSQGVLTGTRLDEVDHLEFKGIHFVPAGLTRSEGKDELRLSVTDAKAAFHAEDSAMAQVTLKDGRMLPLQTTVEPERPKLTLISKNIQPGPSSSSSISLGNTEQLPQDGRLSLLLKSEVPAAFPRTEKIEIASVDGSFTTSLSLTDGSLILQDSQTVLAILDPQKSFGGSAFGPLRFRAVDATSGNGDWQPLVTLVRLPTLKDVHCPASPDEQCTLSGSNLFLIDSIASDSQFKKTVTVPPGFVNATTTVPRPNGTLLYMKLRDDPSTVDKVALPVLPE